jgi:hypothetical protein
LVVGFVALTTLVDFLQQVAGINQYGVGAFSPTSLNFTTAAAPISDIIPVINVALQKPTVNPVSYQWSTATPSSLGRVFLMTPGFLYRRVVQPAAVIV